MQSYLPTCLSRPTGGESPHRSKASGSPDPASVLFGAVVISGLLVASAAETAACSFIVGLGSETDEDPIASEPLSPRKKRMPDVARPEVAGPPPSGAVTRGSLMASTLRAAIKARPLWYFFPLAFLLSWYPWLLSLLRFKASGINPLGVLVAALLVAGLATGWHGLKQVLLRIVRVRVNWRWYAVALLLPLAFVGLALALNLALGAARPAPQDWARWPDIFDRFVFGFLFVGLGEEPGWRGFALPELMRRRRALAASLLLGGIWALWHLPLLGNEFAPAQALPFLITVFAGSVITAWIFNSSGQSVFLTMLMHSTVNAVGAGYVFRFFGGMDSMRMWWIYALLWAAAAVLVAWRTGAALTGFRRG
ncbi:MAG TPA: type II CAAX endopeptidase family protein [Steroidobacteraceae bacterium]